MKFYKIPNFRLLGLLNPDTVINTEQNVYGLSSFTNLHVAKSLLIAHLERYEPLALIIRLTCIQIVNGYNRDRSRRKFASQF